MSVGNQLFISGHSRTNWAAVDVLADAIDLASINEHIWNIV